MKGTPTTETVILNETGYLSVVELCSPSEFTSSNRTVESEDTGWYHSCMYKVHHPPTPVTPLCTSSELRLDVGPRSGSTRIDSSRLLIV